MDNQGENKRIGLYKGEQRRYTLASIVLAENVSCDRHFTSLLDVQYNLQMVFAMLP